MDFFATEIELGNGWELSVEVELLEYEPSYEGRYWGHPDNREPGHGAFIALGKIRAAEELEELGIKDGQEIHPAFLVGGLEGLEDKAIAYQEEPAYDDYGGPDPYDDYWDR